MSPQESSLPALSKGMRSLQRELSERTGQLQKLIRTNFDRFISCKVRGTRDIAVEGSVVSSLHKGKRVPCNALLRELAW